MIYKSESAAAKAAAATLVYNSQYSEDAQLALLAGYLSHPAIYAEVEHILNTDYFDDQYHRAANFIRSHYDQYGTTPSSEVVKLATARDIPSLPPSSVSPDWLRGETERFCQYKALELAVLDGIEYVQTNRYDELQQRITDAGNIRLGDPSRPDDQFSYNDAGDLDLDNIEPTQWLHGERLIRGQVSVLAGPGGVGKTALTVTVAVSLATGRNLVDPDNTDTRWNLHDRNPVNVFLYNLEDDIEESNRRLRAVLNHHQLSQNAVKGRLKIGDGTVRRLCVANVDRQTGEVIRQPCVDALIQVLIRDKIGVLIIDPFVKSHAANENDNGQMDSVMVIFKQIAIEANCAVWLVHHSGKMGTTVDANGSRGASSIIGAARVSETLTKPTEEEKRKFGLDGSYVRLDATKANLSKANHNTMWLKLDGHAVGNSSENYPMGDYRQVMSLIQPQAQTERMDSMIFARVCNNLRTVPNDDVRAWGKAKQNKFVPWVGTAFLDAGYSEVEAKALVKEWVVNGLIRERTIENPRQGRTYTGYILAEDRVATYQIQG